MGVRSSLAENAAPGTPMAQTFGQDGIMCRAGMHLFLIVSIFASLFLGLGLSIAIKRGDWTFLVGAGVGSLVVFLLLSHLKLEIREAGFTYRNLSVRTTRMATRPTRRQSRSGRSRGARASTRMVARARDRTARCQAASRGRSGQ